MYKGKSVSLVIAAGGSGSRMNSDIPKQYLKIGNTTVIGKSVDAFLKTGAVDKIVIAAAEECMNLCREIFKGIDVTVAEGGESRQKSILNALSHVDTDMVLIHDAARPFVSEEIIFNVLEGTCEHCGCICAVKPKDTVRSESMTYDRNTLFNVQTPQGFDTLLLKKAYKKAEEDSFQATDDAGVFEHFGRKVTIVEGSYDNIKITTREDMPMEIKTGIGYDVHRLASGRRLILGGVDIPYDKGLLGHSDADVLVHAIMDALLGAAGLGDIGRLFPDSDDKYKGISSMILLEDVGKRIQDAGYEISNIDSVVIAQKPKISSYLDAMRAEISEALSISDDKINIKGTTTEKLGFEGRGEGIGAQAVCVLTR